MSPDEKELRLLAQDIKLFLRMARTHFVTSRDLAVVDLLFKIADEYGAGENIMLTGERD